MVFYPGQIIRRSLRPNFSSVPSGMNSWYLLSWENKCTAQRSDDKVTLTYKTTSCVPCCWFSEFVFIGTKRRNFSSLKHAMKMMVIRNIITSSLSHDSITFTTIHRLLEEQCRGNVIEEIIKVRQHMSMGD